MNERSRREHVHRGTLPRRSHVIAGRGESMDGRANARIMDASRRLLATRRWGTSRPAEWTLQNGLWTGREQLLAEEMLDSEYPVSRTTSSRRAPRSDSSRSGTESELSPRCLAATHLSELAVVVGTHAFLPGPRATPGAPRP